ncbi:MAG: hypothetical protein WBB28_15800 [Crinalium sp.]
MNNFSPILQKLREKPVLIGLGAIALLSLMVATPKGKPRNLDTPLEALVGHWGKPGVDIHLCYGSTGIQTFYDGSTGEFSQIPYEVNKQNLKDFSVIQEDGTFPSESQIVDKGQKLNIWILTGGYRLSEKPTTSWIYIDDNVERCGRK